jgi:hypothetical protein
LDYGGFATFFGLGVPFCGTIKLMLSHYMKRAIWDGACDQFSAERELIFQVMSVNKCYMVIQEQKQQVKYK